MARRTAASLRASAKVTARLRELAPLGAWRRRGLLSLLGLDAAVLMQALKIAVSAGVSWALAQRLLGSPSPIWAPITASLVALLTVRASVRDAVQRVVAVVIGIAVALWLGGLIGLHAWSISVIVVAGFLTGKILRLIPAAAAQIPINGLFILSLGAGQSVQRVYDTLIGAAVAVIVNFLIAPPNHVSAARRSVAHLADDVIDVLGEMAGGIASPWRREDAAAWLRTARGHAAGSLSAETAVEQAGESLSLLPGRAQWTGLLGRLRQAAATLRTVEIQVRVLARTLRDTADDLPSSGGRQVPLPMAADMLTRTAGAISAFADALVGSSRQPTGRGLDQQMPAAARTAIDSARERIGQISEDIRDMVAANLERALYLGTLVLETGRILDELDTGLDAAFPVATVPDAPPG